MIHKFDNHPVLITGVAGFIGFHLATRLLGEGYEVVGIDNLNDYYDVNLKKARLSQIQDIRNFSFYEYDISDRKVLQAFFSEFSFSLVLHMAAQAGVRYSLENPNAYIDSNLVGFANILEGCRHAEVKHLIFASSSSVYGASTKMPLSVDDNVDHPISLYAATKKANELMAYTYAHLYGMPCTGLRFFTVYGPWGRPDMSYFKFVAAIDSGEAIEVYNHGNMRRDFTYIDDVVESIVRLIPKVPVDDPRYRIYNIGNQQPTELLRLVDIIEEGLGKQAKRRLLPIQPGDVQETFADVESLISEIGYSPSTGIEEGIGKFIRWYQHQYKEIER